MTNTILNFLSLGGIGIFIVSITGVIVCSIVGNNEYNLNRSESPEWFLRMCNFFKSGVEYSIVMGITFYLLGIYL